MLAPENFDHNSRTLIMHDRHMSGNRSGSEKSVLASKALQDLK